MPTRRVLAATVSHSGSRQLGLSIVRPVRRVKKAVVSRASGTRTVTPPSV
jgi:hypothetical protein